MQVDGVLTEVEAAKFVKKAESIGFKHQGSRGSAYGEVIYWSLTLQHQLSSKLYHCIHLCCLAKA